MSTNEAIRAKFPVPENNAERLLQRDTMIALADCMDDAVTRLERDGRYISAEDLQCEAQKLRDYANTLVPVAEVLSK
jgi:hypothetical protein